MKTRMSSFQLLHHKTKQKKSEVLSTEVSTLNTFFLDIMKYLLWNGNVISGQWSLHHNHNLLFPISQMIRMNSIRNIK